MAITQTTYTGNGSTTNYSFTFEYLKQADVKVTLDTVATTAFTFANATTIAFTTAPANGVAIRIFRDTVIDALSSTFFPGSAIKAEDLNENFTQNLYVTQESDNEAALATTTANGAVTTANSAVTTANSAVTTANSANTKSDAAVATANTASTTAGSAVTTANAATTTANSASSAAASAVSTANAADTKADTAISTANTASSNASTAVSTANSANTAAANAVTTADAATVTANNATTTANSAVTTANTANTNATAAQSAATTAQASATAAQTSATAAQTSATAAQAQATLAADVRNAFTITDSNSDGTFDFVVGDIPIKGNNGVKLPFESVTYAEEGAIRYNNSLDKIELYNGSGQWVTAAGGAAVSSSPPSLPSAGDVWYDHDNGRAYVYYNDGDSNQWVEMNPSWNGYVADNSISSAKIIDGAIVNADVNASAAIAGTKISPDFGSQDVLTTGSGSFAGNVTIASSGTFTGSAGILLRADTNQFFINGTADSSSAIDIKGNALINGDGSAYFGSNVGIGSSSPSAQLHVRDSANYNFTVAAGNSTTGMQVGNYDATDGYNPLTLRGSQFLFVATGGNERLRIDSSGRLGLGTSSPSGLLSIHEAASSTSNYINITNNATGTSSWSNGMLVGVNATGDALCWQNESSNLLFGTSNSERMRIDSSGNVGIGTTSPTSKFDVEIGSNAGINFTNVSAAPIIDFKASSVESAGRIRVNEANGGGVMQFATKTTGGTITEAMRIDSSGRVGIGTTSPSSLLHLSANFGAAILTLADPANGMTGKISADTTTLSIGTITNHAVMLYANSTERLRIDSSGRLLVGTTTEGEPNADNLTIADSGSCGITIRSGTVNGGSIYFSDATSGAGEYDGFVSYNQSSRFMQFGTAQAERMRIDSAGNVLVGTTTAVGKMTVKIDTNKNISFNGAQGEIGNVPAFVAHQDGGSLASLGMRGTDLRFATGSAERMRITSSGFVGIGESSPGAQLTVKRSDASTSGLLGGLKLKQGNATSNNRISMLFSTIDDFDIAAVNGVIQTHAGQATNCDGRLEFYTKPTGVTAPIERMRITSDGTLQQGDPSTNGGWSAFVSDNGSAHQRGRFIIRAKSTTGGVNEILQIFLGTTAKLLIRADGNLYNAAGGIGVLSDLKLKENIVSANSQWGDIKAIQIRNFNFKEETGHDTHTQIGVVAQEVETVSPGLVSDQPDKDKDGNDLGTITKVVNTSVLYMKAVKALQEAMERIETLEAKVNALEGA